MDALGSMLGVVGGTSSSPPTFRIESLDCKGCGGRNREAVCTWIRDQEDSLLSRGAIIDTVRSMVGALPRLQVLTIYRMPCRAAALDLLIGFSASPTLTSLRVSIATNSRRPDGPDNVYLADPGAI